MTGKRGVTLIEVVVVMAIVAITFGLVGPRIGAGLGQLELKNAAQSVRGLVRIARLQAQRTEQSQYVVLDRNRRLVSYVNNGMKVVREVELPSSVELKLDGDVPVAVLYVTPSGLLRGAPVRLQGRSSELEVQFQ